MSSTAMAKINLYLLTFNCARTLVQPHQFAPPIFDALPENVSTPDILVLSLQEIAPIAYAFLGGSFLTPYFNALREAIRLVAKEYFHIVSRNLGTTAIMIFAKDPTMISSLETAGVGVGLHEMGNKGAVGVRLVYAETQLTFVAAHLAPMEDAIMRRNEDWENIVKKMIFTSDVETMRAGQDEDVPLLEGFRHENGSELGMYSSRSHLFVAGDLNYRVSEAKPTVSDVETFPQPTDNPDSANHFLKLLKRDQLLQQLKHGKSMQGFSEAEIKFPPTYKLLESKDPTRWNWARHRWPSWCDRVLYLDLPAWMQKKIIVNNYDALPQLETSDHRPVVLSLSVPLQAIAEPPDDQDDVRLHFPYDTDLDWKSRRAMARKKEIVVGIAAYLCLTWEGNGLLLATLIGGIGSWLVIRSLLAV
jgi:hypothetical protein